MNFVSEAFNKKHHVISIFCDLRKAFDTVNHNILYSKLSNLGIRNIELLWFKNYLTGRKQYVHVNGSSSGLSEILIGVPQGSILGPILFLLYINDLPNASLLKSLLFANDTTLLASGPNIEDLCNFVNTEFGQISYYFRKNKLALHPNKTNFMIFTTSPEVRNTNCKLFINNNNPGNPVDPALLIPITRISSHSENPYVKFLGIHIDPDLNFKYHLQVLNNKLSTSLYFLRAVKNTLTFKALKSVYYTLIHSHLVYCIHIWSSCSLSNMNAIFKKQKIAIRLINNSPYNSHTESLFKANKILPLPTLADYFKLQFMYQFFLGLLPTSFNNVWTTNLARCLNVNVDPLAVKHNLYVLRNNDDLYIPPSRLVLTDKFPLRLYPTLWMNLDNHDVKLQRNKNLFNSKLKEYFLSKLETNFV